MTTVSLKTSRLRRNRHDQEKSASAPALSSRTRSWIQDFWFPAFAGMTGKIIDKIGVYLRLRVHFPKRSFPKTTFYLLTTMMCAIPLLGMDEAAYSQRVDVDSGIIFEINGNLISMQGEKGNHLFEMIGACTWCEEGESITAVFEGFTRVEIYPRPNRLQRPPVRGFIVRDGRQEF